MRPGTTNSRMNNINPMINQITAALRRFSILKLVVW
jgi:hypothetical protein